MSSISEQISAVAQTTLTNPLAVINALSRTAFGSIEKIIALNMHTVKQSLESSTTTARELFSASKPQELFTFGAVQAQPHIEKMVAYGHELADISAQTRNEFLSSLTHSETVIAKVTSHQLTKTITSTPVAKLAKKATKKNEVLTTLTTNTQLPLLVETEVNVAKKSAPKTKKSVAVNKTNSLAVPLEIKAVTTKPAASTKTSTKKPVTSKLIEAEPIAKAAIKPAAKVVDTKPVAVKPETVAPVETTPVAESPVEKKSVVKMPFPASPIKKPAFPTVSTRPAYKAKGSSATGAKKPVRQ
jgi:phasin family protein